MPFVWGAVGAASDGAGALLRPGAVLGSVLLEVLVYNVGMFFSYLASMLVYFIWRGII